MTDLTAAGPNSVGSAATTVRHWRIGVVLITVIAVAIRVQNIARNKAHIPLSGDAFIYFLQAEGLLQGHGFVDPLPSATTGVPVPSAAHPPGFVMLIAFLRRIGLDTPLGIRYAMAILGAATVVVIALVARRILGTRAGLIAGFVAAVYPQLWINDAMLMSETLFVFGIAVGFWGVYAYAQDRAWAQLGFASFGFALAATARSETLLCFPLIFLPLVLAHTDFSWAPRLRHLALAAVFPLLWLVPWGVYNSSRFDKPVPVATGFGWTLAQANCAMTYSGPLLGSFSIDCLKLHPPAAPPPGKHKDESVIDAHFRSVALDYIRAHLGSQPKVIAAREGRVWAVWRPGQLNKMDNFVEGRGSLTLITWSQRAYWVLGILAVGGFWVFRRHGIRLYPLVVEIGVTAFVAAITFGNTRYRAGAELCIVLLATGTIDWIIERLFTKWRPKHGSPDPTLVDG